MKTVIEILVERINTLEAEVAMLRKSIENDRSQGERFGVGTYGPLTAEEHASQLRNYRIVLIGALGKTDEMGITASDRKRLQKWLKKGQELVGAETSIPDTLFWI